MAAVEARRPRPACSRASTARPTSKRSSTRPPWAAWRRPSRRSSPGPWPRVTSAGGSDPDRGGCPTGSWRPSLPLQLAGCGHGQQDPPRAPGGERRGRQGPAHVPGCRPAGRRGHGPELLPPGGPERRQRARGRCSAPRSWAIPTSTVVLVHPVAWAPGRPSWRPPPPRPSPSCSSSEATTPPSSPPTSTPTRPSPTGSSKPPLSPAARSAWRSSAFTSTGTGWTRRSTRWRAGWRPRWSATVWSTA